MLGLCHICFTSNITVIPHKGFVICQQCKDYAPEKKEEEKKEKILDFEDLPSISPEERSISTYKMISELFDKQLLEKIAEDRRFDKGY